MAAKRTTRHRPVADGRSSGSRAIFDPAELESLGAVRREVEPETVSLKLAQPRKKAFSARGWLWELKYDGFRVLGAKRSGRAQLLYRRGTDAARAFPEISKALLELPVDCVLDGELVVCDESGRPVFQRLLKRSMLQQRGDIELAAARHPALLYAFDLIAIDGWDVRPLPLLRRKELLRRLLPKDARLRWVDHVEDDGEALLAQVARLGLEGVVGKRADAPYRDGRGPDWVKVALGRTGDFAVVGYANDFRALYLAVHDGKQLVYAGSVGSGFGPREVENVRARLKTRSRSTPPCIGESGRDPERIWCEPELVVEVRYKDWPEGHLVREPVFLRFRDDKRVDECAAPERELVSPRGLKLSNLDKLFWPEDGIRKGDLVAYYRDIAHWLLPYLKDRPVMMTRYPDGIHGKHFFQKDAPSHAPPYVRTEPMRNEDGRQINQLLCDDADTLVYLANLGTIPLHVWSSRVGSLERPDWCVLDLDPKTAPFEHVLTLANAIRALCEEIGLPCFCKTSGSSGLHVFVPLAGQCEHGAAVKLAEVLATIVQREHSDIATLDRSIERRKGRVYIDCYQNGMGKLIVSPFAVRPLPTAPVSMPLKWSEVKKGLSPRQFTLRDAVARMERLGADPLRPVLSTVADLAAAIGRLQQRGA